MSNNGSAHRVVMIGLDGATFNIIEPLLKQNKLPFFQRLIDTGSYGTVESNLPVNSASNWATLLSGKNPGKHNIYDFLVADNGSYQPKLITNQSLKSPALWNLINSHQFQTISLNIPIISDPEPLNGIIVPGVLSPGGKVHAYPEQVTKELEQQNYTTDSGFARNLNPDVYFHQIKETLLTQEKVFQQMLKQHPWKVAILILNALDKVQHSFWHEEEKVNSLYIQIDHFLNNIFDSLDANTYFIVVSQHGFKRLTRKFFVNEWLWEIGLLQKNISIHQPRLTDMYDLIFKDAPDDKHLATRFLAKSGITKDNIRSMLPLFIAEFLKRLVPWKIKKYFPAEYLDIVWDHTRAYFVSSNIQGININLKGREPQGIVNPGSEYEELRDRIIGELYRLKDPYTFENVIDEIYRKEDLFQGEYLDNAPDIILVPHNYDYYLDPAKRTCRLFIGSANDDYPIHAFHHPQGIFLATGPNIKQKYKLSHIDICDITPSILHILGITSTEDFDGQILYRMFENQPDYYYMPQQRYHDYSSPNSIITEEYYDTGLAIGTAIP